MTVNISFCSSCLHRASIVSKHLFIIPADAHYYNITGMLKTTKFPIIAPTCWFLREPKHVGAIIGILIVFNIPVIL